MINMGVIRIDTLGRSGGSARTGVPSGSRGYNITKAETAMREAQKKIESSIKKDETVIVNPKTQEIIGTKKGSDIGTALRKVRNIGGTLRAVPTKREDIKRSAVPTKREDIKRSQDFSYIGDSGLYNKVSAEPLIIFY